VQSYLRDANIFALPCIDLRGHGEHVDGIPVAIMEAMAAGLPVVSTDISGIPELIEDGVSGVLVPAGEAAALADAVIALLDDPERARSLGRGGRARVEALFNLEKSVGEMKALFAAAVGRG